MLGTLHVVPVAYAVVLALFDWRIGVGPPRFVGVGNFQAILRDPSVWNTLTTSGTFLVLDVLAILAAGLLLALALDTRPRGAGVWCALVLAPWATTAVVAGVIWRWILEPDVGLLTALTGGWGRAALMTPGGATVSVVVADTWRTLGFAVVFLLAGLQTLDPEIYAAARIDGAGAWQTIRHIAIPLLRPIVGVVTILLTLHALNSMEIIWVLTGGGPARATETAALRVYREVFTYFDLGVGAAWGMVLVLTNVMLATAYLRGSRVPSVAS
ncbi:MAG: carbohydrate ABC transporter permease [Candidatus Rokuibacteriota bacterium]